MCLPLVFLNYFHISIEKFKLFRFIALVYANLGHHSVYSTTAFYLVHCLVLNTLSSPVLKSVTKPMAQKKLNIVQNQKNRFLT